MIPSPLSNSHSLHNLPPTFALSQLIPSLVHYPSPVVIFMAFHHFSTNLTSHPSIYFLFLSSFNISTVHRHSITRHHTHNSTTFCVQGNRFPIFTTSIQDSPTPPWRELQIHGRESSDGTEHLIWLVVNESFHTADCVKLSQCNCVLVFVSHTHFPWYNISPLSHRC